MTSHDTKLALLKLQSQLNRCRDINDELLRALREIATHAGDYQRMQIVAVAHAAISKADGMP